MRGARAPQGGDGSAFARAVTCALVGWLLGRSWPDVSAGGVPEWQLYGFALGALFFVFMVMAVLADFSRLISNISRTWRSMRPGTKVAAGGWLSVREAKKAGFGGTKGLFLGVLMHLPIFLEDFVHGVILAPTRRGKTITFILPNLMRDIGTSRFVTDLRGDLTIQTAERIRAQGQKVIVIDPAGTTGEPSESYNILQIILDDLIDAPQDAISDAASLAMQIYQQPARAVSDPFWPQGTRKTLTFPFVAVCALRKPEEANLPNVHAILSNDAAFELLLLQARKSAKLGGDLASMANNILAVWRKTPKIFETFREGALQSLAPFSASGRFAPTMYECSFRFNDLKEEKSTLFLAIDGSRMETAAPYIGVMTWAALKEMIRAPNDIPVTFLLDEFTAYPLPQIPLALTALAGHGVRLWMVAQEMKELQRVYGPEALATIMSQSDTKVFFGINEPETASLVSRMLGQKTVVAENFGLAGGGSDTASVSISHTAKPVESEEELRRMEDDEAIMFHRNLRAGRLKRLGFHEIVPMRTEIKPNPFFGGKRLLGTVKMKLRGERAIVTRAGRGRQGDTGQPFWRPLFSCARFLVPGTGSLPMAALLALILFIGVPHIRFEYTATGSFEYRTIHSCHFIGPPLIGHSFWRYGHENCPLITWVKLGERP